MTNGDSQNPTPSTIRPGWYDDGHHRQRWHDGTSWTEQVQKPARRKRAIPLWLGVTATVLALLVGAGIGGSNGKAPAVASSVEYRQLVGQNKSMSDDQEALEERLESTKDDLSATRKDLAELKVASTSLDSRLAAVQDRESALVAREAALRAAEEALLATPAPVGVAPVAPVPVPTPAPAPAYFDNCTAARNAGAAPVRTGDPGYGRHLDRDGDGVGCE